jgi:hypothetical protein
MDLGQKKLHIPVSAKLPLNDLLDSNRVEETFRNHSVPTAVKDSLV